MNVTVEICILRSKPDRVFAHPASRERVVVARPGKVEIELVVEPIALLADEDGGRLRAAGVGFDVAEGSIMVAIGRRAGIVEQGVGGTQCVELVIARIGAVIFAEEVALLIGRGSVQKVCLIAGIGLLEDLAFVVDEFLNVAG